MELLHPVYTISTIILLVFSMLEGYGADYKNYRGVWLIVAGLILFSGFRYMVGADYLPYMKMYPFYGIGSDYSQIWSEALFKDDGLDVEWLYVLLNKFFFGISAPFFIFTFIIAMISIIPKFFSFEKNSVYPALSLLLYMYPTYFIGDSGQIRQGAALAFVVLSFEFIKKRRVIWFLVMLYIAVGFHKSAILFLPAYWLCTVPMKKWMILSIIILCVALSPFNIYNSIGLLDSIAPEEIISGFSNYSELEGTSGGIKLYDVLCALYTFLIVTFNKEACAKIPYYEYMRNIAIIGICMYFIFRGSPIFSTRLVASYMIFIPIVLPNIVASIDNLVLRRYLYTILLAFVVCYYFIFTIMQGAKGSFTTSLYYNFLWN